MERITGESERDNRSWVRKVAWKPTGYKVKQYNENFFEKMSISLIIWDFVSRAVRGQ